jgi:prepilin-type N-terminal cleavage/methylation domain-containing protein
MLNTYKTSRRGFTITEILIAVLLVLILSAIAVPRLLGNQRQAEDTAAKAQLRTSAEVARNLMYESGNRFTTDVEGGPNTQLALDEPNIEFVKAPAPSIQDPKTNRRSVSVHTTTTGTEWIASALGGTSNDKYNCWYIKLSTSKGDMFALEPRAVSPGTPNNCRADDLPAKWEPYEFPSAID